tara:strand:- start:691 stop:1281 length:591 start_codon:yes stop_codon:yes gene_type:complete
MKNIYLIFLLLLVSCTSGKLTYICGDRPCVDKKEINEYFSKNMVIEIEIDDNYKDKTVDLVKLNTNANIEIDNDKSSINENKIFEKINKIKEEKKIAKLKVKEDRRLAKIQKKKDKKRLKEMKNKKDISDKNILKKIEPKVEKNYEIKIVKKKSINRDKRNYKILCLNSKDCDIDKISEILIKKGSEKGFPSLSTN